MDSQTDMLLLYDHPLSSYAQKVRIALREKHVPFERQVPAGLGSGQHNKELSAANPRQEVPALIDGATRIFDSTIILEYLEDKYPTPALLPPVSDPAARARARMIEEVCDTHYEATNWGYAEVVWYERGEGETNGATNVGETLKAQAELHTRDIQAWLSAKLGTDPFFGGETFEYADCAVAPLVNRSIGYGLGPEPGSALQLWHARVSERPSVKETFGEFDIAVASIANMKDAFKTGERKREYRDHRLEWMVKAGGISVVEAGLRDGNVRFSWPRPDPPQ